MRKPIEQYVCLAMVDQFADNIGNIKLGKEGPGKCFSNAIGQYRVYGKS